MAASAQAAFAQETLAQPASVQAVSARSSEGAATAYVRARAAQALGDPSTAAAAYARALAADPANTALAAEALRQAIQAGDWALATSVAARLERAGAMPIEGVLWTLTDAVKRGKWREASAATERLSATGGFGVIVPVIRAWIVLGARAGDPLASLSTAGDAASRAYSDEHRALLLLATKRRDLGAGAIAAAASGAGGRSQRLRLAGAARLAALGDREAAAALLVGDDDPMRVGRRLLAAGKAIPGAVETPADGLAELFVRFAVDLQRERVTPLALAMARLSTHLASGNSETWLVAAELLAADERSGPALQALRQVSAEDPFAGVARAMRTQMLVRGGDLDTALAEARTVAGSETASVAEIARYGDLLVEAKRFADAVPLYARAIALRAGGAPGADLWLLHLLHGSALEEADRWPEAKAALQAAYRIAPGEAQVLNYLGYAQLERRENLDAAEALIREASRLQPDDASITDSLGWALFRRGKTAEAIAVLERASAADPRQAEIGEHLGDAYWTAGRRVDARYAWSAALLHAATAEAARLTAKLDTGLTPAVAAP